jgi:hypothetical protein
MRTPLTSTQQLEDLFGCRVTVAAETRRGTTRCGLPVVANGLCAKHEAERIRLGGDL